MSGFIEGESRSQATLFPESLDEYIAFSEKDIGGITQVSFDALPEHTRALYEAIIQAMDSDSDGKISFDEYQKLLVGFLGHQPGGDEKSAFQRADGDGDGSLTLDEARQFVTEFVLSNDPDAPGSRLLG